MEYNTSAQAMQNKEPPHDVHENVDGQVNDTLFGGEPGTKTISALPCRIVVQARGIEWFIYNRSPAYDTILRGMSEQEEEMTDVNIDEKQNMTSTFSPDSRTSTNQRAFTVNETSFPEMKNKTKGFLDRQQYGKPDSVSSRASSEPSLRSASKQNASPLPGILKLLPIKIQCTKGAIVMGNQNTRSVLTAKFESAVGYLEVKNARLVDKYKQVIDVNFVHPVVQFRHNKDFKENQIAEGARNKFREEQGSGSVQVKHTGPSLTLWAYNAWNFLRILKPFTRGSTTSLVQDHGMATNGHLLPERSVGVNAQNRWLGLTRYLDDDDDLVEQERWKAIEYGQFPTILNSPNIAMSLYWDVPGLVPPSNDSYSGSFPNVEDINGSNPPDWGVHLRVSGGNIRYGPWTDRQRADLQAVFFPSLHKDTIPAAKLEVGKLRVSTVFKLVIEIEEQITVGIPTREESKDWKWKGRDSVEHETDREHKSRKINNKKKKGKKVNQSPEVRPFGWLDVKIFPDSTISFTMDLVARSRGYDNRVDIDLRRPEISTSVNHGVLLRSESQKISCDLSYPLEWNKLHPWHIAIQSDNPEIFLLRDHIFLLTDLITDWTSGPSGDFHRFVPYDYAINLRLINFQLYINANDFNIINNPSDIEDNTFITVHGKTLNASLALPLKTFQPIHNQIVFNVDAHDGGIRLYTPPWDTYHTFLDDSNAAMLEDIRLNGSYTYHTSTSPELTDIFILNMEAFALKLNLHGFLVRYFMKIKDNYFGEDLHFRTLDEHQAQITRQGKPDNEISVTAHHSRLSNDLDVILSITVDQSCILLPTHIYSTAEHISMDISSIGLDLRFTNYYMDLAVEFSPISISHSNRSQKEKVDTANAQGAQVFIDGIEIFSHRLFGLPPTEPTYVCNWDFGVGSISGECSIEFVQSLITAVRSFSFTFQDKENALVCAHSQVIHDVTFLRARIKPMRVWLRFDEAALLFDTQAYNIRYDDLAGSLFSEHLYMVIPRLALAMVIVGKTSLNRDSLRSSITANLFFETSIDTRMVKRKQNYSMYGQLQQRHIGSQDVRTHRVPWLVKDSEHAISGGPYNLRPKTKSPAMPFPLMPEPVLEILDPKRHEIPNSTEFFHSYASEAISSQKNSFLTTSSPRQSHIIRSRSSSTDRHWFENSVNDQDKVDSSSLDSWSLKEQLQQQQITTSPIRQSSILHDYDTKPFGKSINHVNFAFSSPYKRPHFPLFYTSLDLSSVPALPNHEPAKIHTYNTSATDIDRLNVLDQNAELTSYILQLHRGLKGVFDFAAVIHISTLLTLLQSSNPIVLMDNLQIDAMTEVYQSTIQRRKYKKVVEIQCIIPHVEVHFMNPSVCHNTIDSLQYRYDLSLSTLLATARSSKTSSDDVNNHVSHESSMNLRLGLLQFSAKEVRGNSSNAQSALQLVVNDMVLWMLTGLTTTIDLQFLNSDVTSATEDSKSKASLLQHAIMTVRELLQESLVVRNKESLRIRLLVLFLSVNGGDIPDPPFLTKASYVLRSATTHLRTFDSWKMISRLRYIYQSLSDRLLGQILSQCTQEPLECPEDAGNQVIASFDHWRAWDVAHVRQSTLMQKVFGSLMTASRIPKRPLPLNSSFRAGRIGFYLQPQRNKNEIILERLTGGIAMNQTSNTVDTRILGDGPIVQDCAIQGFCHKANTRIDWDLIHYFDTFHNLLSHLPEKQNARNKKALAVMNSIKKYHLHVALSLGMMTVGLETINLQATSTCQGLTASFVLDSALNYQTSLENALINVDLTTTRIWRKSRLLAFSQLQRLSILGSNFNVYRDSAEERMWKMATFCEQFSFELCEEPLGLLKLAQVLLMDEASDISILNHKLRLLSKSQSSPEKSTQREGIQKLNLSLSLGLYLISFTILPSLKYSIWGKGAQTSMLPGQHRKPKVILDFDLKEHSHVFTKHTGHVSEDISKLQIPSINSRYCIDLSANRKLAVLRTLIEKVTLDASAVHVLLNTLNRPEISSLATQVTSEFTILKKGLQQRFPTEPVLHDPYRVQASTQYNNCIILAGLIIHISTQQSVDGVGLAQFQFNLGQIRLKATNRSPDLEQPLNFPDLEIRSNGVNAALMRSEKHKLHPCGHINLGLVLKSNASRNERNELIRAYQVQSHGLSAEIYAETASMVLEILAHLQDTLKTIDVPKEVKGLRRLTLGRLRSETPIPNDNDDDDKTNNLPLASPLFNDMYSLIVTNIRVSWRVELSNLLTPSREVEDLVLSFTKIDLATKRDNAARLLIEDFQLQMVPKSKISQGRSLNSALLPEVVFNVAYLSTKTDRRLAFQAAGKSLDLRLTSQFILPASDLRRSIAIAVEDIRKATSSWNTSILEGSNSRRKLLGKKRLTSLLVDADFAGAVVYIQGRTVSDPHALALTVLRGGRPAQHGRYGQFTQENSSSSTTLRAPGIALKVEYKDLGIERPSLNAEFKVDASSNILYPTVVPLIMEISSSIKEIVGESESHDQPSETKLSPPKFLGDERLRTADPSTIFGDCRLNLGLRICRQEFSLSCQPIARVSTTAHFEAIYITVNTIQSAESGQFFTLSATVDHLQASVQHVYSRDSTGSFEVNSVVLSLMNSKHISKANGLSAILKISPMKIQINAKQLHDFLLFREIWVPPDLRRPSPVPEPTPSLGPQAFVVQRYQQVASASAFPWNATISIAELDVQLELGQSLGKSAFIISNFWVSSKKSSDWEQNLCLELGKVSIDSIGRMSGYVELQNFKVRTSIHWPARFQRQAQAPLIQASVGFDHLRIKVAFDFQAFLIADITTFEFLMYNVRDSRQSHGDRLVGTLDGAKVQVFCTTASASQGLALYQAFERLVQEKRSAYEISLQDLEKFLRRKSSVNPSVIRATVKHEERHTHEKALKAPIQLQTNVVVNLKAINVGAFPSTFFDNQIFKLEALDISARFSVVLDGDKLHSSLGLTLGQLRVALSGISRANVPKTLGEISIDEVVASAVGSRGGTILKVPKVVATMQTWQSPQSTHIAYIFGSSFQGKVDVGWNYSWISFLRGMWAAHTRALAQRLGKPLPPSALQITGGLQTEGDESIKSSSGGGQEKITAVVNVPQSKFQYTALQPPIIETPQLRDMGEATPPLEWIGLHRERLPNLTHQIVIVSLLEVAKEVEDAYQRILGSS